MRPAELDRALPMAFADASAKLADSGAARGDDLAAFE
jgi:hypothetical protein